MEAVEAGEAESVSTVSTRPGSKAVTMEETELEVDDEGYDDVDE